MHEHQSTFAHYTVKQWNEGALGDFETTAYRIAVDYLDAESWPEKLGRFVSQPHADQVQALSVGAWWTDDHVDTTNVIAALVAHHARLPNLRALFIADLISDEIEISWIEQSDISPLFMAYPHLEHFGIRGAFGIQLGHIQHQALRSFTIESGGMPSALLEHLAKADLPRLVDLELWTGSRFYGWTGTLEDLLPFITGEIFPSLTRLAIRNCAIADEVAIALSESVLFERLETIDLSMGTLSDVGFAALMTHPALRRLNLYDHPLLPGMPDEVPSPFPLKTLDIRHHFCSEASLRVLEAVAKHGFHIYAGDPKEDHDERGDSGDGRYVAVGE